MLPLLNNIELRAIETQNPGLMHAAGEASARWISARFSSKHNILLLAGPGNNGGDAFATATALRRRGFHPWICDCSDTDNPRPKDAEGAVQNWLQLGGEILDEIPEQAFDLVVDGLFGIGLNRAISGYALEVIEWVNQLDCPVLALDVPSGLNGYTGIKTGPCIQADWTVTFISYKDGLLTGRHADYCGQVFLDHLGLELPSTSGKTLSLEDVQAYFPSRQRANHKGSSGSVGVIGGNEGMTGAALLAGRAALYSGAGRVYVGLLHASLSCDPTQPELMLQMASKTLSLEHLSCLVVGPGLGDGSAALHALDLALKSSLPLVLDADALNLIAHFPHLKDVVRHRNNPTLLTPHPAEAARLLHTSTAEIENNRVTAALQLAKEWQAAVNLKGSGSVIAFKEGHYYINTTGNPGLASAGQGDVLAGVIGALLAQGLSPEKALITGVCIHGSAADQLVISGVGPVGLTASETSVQIRNILNQHQQQS